MSEPLVAFSRARRNHQLLFMEGRATVWSWANYPCYRCGNVAAILELGGNIDEGFPGSSPEKLSFDSSQIRAVGHITKIWRIVYD
jgi:hypothetical protein